MLSQQPNKCIISMHNSWATPLIYKPLIHGVDVLICDLTKYLIRQPSTDPYINIDNKTLGIYVYKV